MQMHSAKGVWVKIVRQVSLLVAAFVVIAGAVLPGLVAAQAATTRPPLSLTTSPIPISVVTVPGKTVTADVRVKNNSTRAETLRIDLQKFGASDDNGNPRLLPRESKDTYFDWVSFSEKQFVAEPNVWKTIKMTITTPPSAAFGYYFAVIFSRSSPDKPTGGASAVEGGVASLVLLDVEAPGASRQAQVIAMTADRKIYEFLPANFNVRLKNVGNVHVAPVGNIFIKQGDKQVALLEFNTARGNILPRTERQFDTSWNDGFPHYDVTTVGSKTTKKLVWNFQDLQKFRIGRYTATMVAVYDNGQRDVPIQSSVSFWVIPWRILGVALLIVLLIGFGLWMIFRSIFRGIFRRHKKQPPESPPTATPPPVASPAAPVEAPDANPAVDDAATAPLLPAKPKSPKSSETTTAPEVKER